MNTFITKSFSKLTVLVWIVLMASNFSVASDTTPIKANTSDFASQACVIAATEGLTALRTFSNKNNVNFYEVKRYLTCNGKSLEHFADLNKADITRSAKLVPSDNSTLSQACIDALSIGEKQALKKHSLTGHALNCNGVTLATFVERSLKHTVKLQKLDVLAKSE